VQVTDVAFRHRDDPDVAEGEPLMQPGGVFLVSREPIERFRDNHIEQVLGGVPHQGLDAWAEQ
jgi:hypothetical protein